MPRIVARGLAPALCAALVLLAPGPGRRPGFAQTAPPAGFNVKINFQPAASTAPRGYLADSGQAFGAREGGHTYGWSVDLSANPGFTTDRGSSLSPDDRYDTQAQMQSAGDVAWEIAVPAGTYNVQVVAGDPALFDGLYRINVEGVLVVDGAPSSARPWVAGTRTVSVTDGRLTLSSAPGAVGNRLCFVSIAAPASDEDAARISAAVNGPAARSLDPAARGLHAPYGTILDPWIDRDYQGEFVWRYTRAADSAIWTGHYLAAEGFRYRAATDPAAKDEALQNVRQTLRGIRSLIDVTGPDGGANVLARCLVPDGSPYLDWIRTEEGHHGIYAGAVGGANYQWVGGTSRDQYSGVFFGLAVAYDMVTDAEAMEDGTPVREFIRADVTRMLDFLLSNGWAVVMPDGSSSTVFTGRYEQQLNFLQIGRRVNPERFGPTYQGHRQQYASSVNTPIWYDSLNTHSSYFKFNLDYINLYNLIRLEEASSPYRSSYLGAYNTLRNATAGHGNAHFNMVDREVRGASGARDAETRALLDRWLLRPGFDHSADLALTSGYAACGDNRACSPVPVEERTNTDFLWQRSPFHMKQYGYGAIRAAGIDYILPYWMARYYGVLGGGAALPQPPAAPGGLTATASSSDRVDLSWTDNSADESGFKIERCQGDGCASFAPVAEVGPGAIAFSDTGRAAGTSYTYRVRAYNANGDSGYSNHATALTPAAPVVTTPPAAPGNLAAAAASSTRIDLAWSDNSANEDGFRIERCAGAKCTGFVGIKTVGAGVRTYQDAGLDARTTYRYRVRAYNAAGDSAYSNTASATTKR